MEFFDPDDIAEKLKKEVQGSETFNDMMMKIAIYIVSNYRSKNNDIEDVDFKDTLLEEADEFDEDEGWLENNKIIN